MQVSAGAASRKDVKLKCKDAKNYSLWLCDLSLRHCVKFLFNYFLSTLLQLAHSLQSRQ